MEFGNVTLLAAFVAGLFSFLSPCILPLLPTFSAMLAGTVIDQEDDSGKLYVNTVCFLLGFTLVFIMMGATASLVGEWFFDYQPELKKIGAVLIIMMGVMLTGMVRITPLEREYRPFLLRTFHGPFGAFLLGSSFPVGWTPCTGPILASILLYAGGTATIGMGIVLLLVYAMGFSIPFFLLVVLLRKYLFRIRNIYEWLPKIQQLAGYLLILMGILMWMDWIDKGLGIIWSIFQ